MCLWSPTEFVQATTAGDVCVALIDGQVMSDHQAETMSTRLHELAEVHGGRVVVSLAHADGSSMSLLAALARVQTRCAQRGGRLVLCSVPAGLAGVLERFGLRARFTVVAELAEAIDAARTPGRAGRTGWWLSVLARRAA